MTRYYILTNWVSVLDWDGHRVAARRPNARKPTVHAQIVGNEVVFCRDDAAGAPVRLGGDTHGELVESEAQETHAISATPCGHHSYFFALSDIYLCASPENHVRFCASRPVVWETFRLISDTEYDALAYFCDNNWHSKGSGIIVSKDDIKPCDHFRLTFDEKIIHTHEIIETVLRYRKYEGNDHPKQIRITHDHWRQDTLSLYKPAIYYCAFHKEGSFSCLNLSVKSLIDQGKYNGDIVLITEKNDKYLKDTVLPSILSGISIQNYLPIDAINFMSARFDIESLPALAPYQPVLYMDLDTLVQQDITPILHAAIAQSETNFFVFTETDTPETNTIWGKLLFEDDRRAPQPYGFTTGIMMYRNVQVARPALMQIRHVIRGQAAFFGERLIERLFDQPVANYVLHTQELPDATLLTQACINKNEWDMLASNDTRYEEVVASLKTKTIIHFAGGVGSFGWKIPAMERYAAYLNRATIEEAETLPAVMVDIPREI